MGIKNIFNQKYVSKAPNPKEEALYKRVLDEVESGKRRTGIMAKAIADSLGDSGKAESLYIKYRMQTLMDEDKYDARLLVEERQQAQEKVEKDAKEKKERDESLLEKKRLAEEKKERDDKLAQVKLDKERWRGTMRYKVINFSWKALAIYIVYFLINFKVLEYPLPSITFIDEFLFPILIRS